MNRNEVVRAIAEVIAGLQMPVSLGMQLGVARDPWDRLHRWVGFGWHDADEVERKLRAALDQPDPLAKVPAG